MGELISLFLLLSRRKPVATLPCLPCVDSRRHRGLTAPAYTVSSRLPGSRNNLTKRFAGARVSVKNALFATDLMIAAT
jgi:hypothetical protein